MLDIKSLRNSVSDTLSTYEVNRVLDEIESRIMEVRQRLEDIKGLTEINQITQLVTTLEKDLY